MTEQKCRICGIIKENHRAQGHAFVERVIITELEINKPAEVISGGIIRKGDGVVLNEEQQVVSLKEKREYCKDCHCFKRKKTGKCKCPEEKK